MPKGIEELNPVTSLSGDELLLTQQSSDDMKVTLSQIVALVKDEIFPIGSIYTQLPSQLDPTGLNYPGTWTNVSSEYSGDFFRVEGGEASTFGSGEQTDQFQGHKMRIYGKSGYTVSNGSLDVAVDTPNNTLTALNTSYSYAGAPFTDGTNGTPRVGSETRPVNQTIRVWKRTA